MKRTLIYIAALLAISITTGIITTSCEKVINVDLNTANPALVIEGNITNLPGPYTVTLTKTTSYFDNVTVPRVTGAKVVITDDAGGVDTLIEIGAGIYNTTHIQGQIGRTYTLKVVSESKTYQAVSTMPDTVSIQYLTYEFRNGRPASGDSSGYHVHCHFADPAGVKNYYRAMLTYRDTIQNGSDNITNFEDNLSDGRPINLTVRGQSFRLGDSTKVFLISEDANVFEYFKVLRSIVDAGGVNSTSTPQNPPSNISNGALGYFCAGAIVSVSDVAHK